MCFGGVALEGPQKGEGGLNGNNELSLKQSLEVYIHSIFILSFSEYLHFNYVLIYT